jgi:hypothetical protein
MPPKANAGAVHAEKSGAAVDGVGVMPRKRPKHKRPRPGPPFQSCVNCTNGWREKPGLRYPRMERCDCWFAHMERIASLEDVNRKKTSTRVDVT